MGHQLAQADKPDRNGCGERSRFVCFLRVLCLGLCGAWNVVIHVQSMVGVMRGYGLDL